MFRVQAGPIEPLELKALLQDPRAGALVSFEGLVRNHNQGQAVAGLEYECCLSLALAEAARIFAEARERFAVYQIVCVHRTGQLQIGEIAVWTGASAAHRDVAFEACRYLIDQLKLRLPIWKKEYYRDGASEWVNCQQRCSGHAGQHSAAQAPMDTPALSRH